MLPSIQLWSGPRNVSTALMYSFAQRNDTRVWDEPLYAAYLLRTGLDHPGREDILAHHDADAHRVIDKMLHGHRDRPWLFCKQMGHHLLDLPTEWLSGCTNVFLIRHPAEVLISFSKVISQPSLRDIGIAHQWEIFQELRQLGQSPLVIAGNELLRDPEAILRQACQQIGMEFDPAMLQWPAGPRPEDGIWARHWYANVHQSTGFAPYEPREHSLPPDLQPVLEAAMPAFEGLSTFALRA